MRINVTYQIIGFPAIFFRSLVPMIIPVMIMANGVLILPISLTGSAITSGTGIWPRYKIRPKITESITGDVPMVFKIAFRLVVFVTTE